MAREGWLGMTTLGLAGTFVLAGCGTGFDTDPALEPLAKADGWRGELEPTATPFAVVEIAYDRETAEAAWHENVPGEVEERGSTGPGVFGDLDRVDFGEEAVIVWSSGESGSCPGWLADIDTAQGRVVLERDRDKSRLSDACTADYRPYRMILAVDRERLPAADELPITDVEGVPDGLVDAYPASREAE